METNASTAYYESVPPLTNNFSINFRPYTSRGFLLHWHEHTELLYFRSGNGGTVWLNGQPITVAPRDLVIISGSSFHSFEAPLAMEYDCVLVYPSFLSDVSFSPAWLPCHLRGDDEVAAIFSELSQEYSEGRLAQDIMMKSIVYRLFAYLARRYPAKEPPVSSAVLEYRRLAFSRLSSVMQYVAAHYKETLTTRHLAEAAYLSEGHFCRSFKEATGKTPLAYIMEYRIDRAAALLRHTELSVTEVALQTGFFEVNYFSRVFRRVKGVSPTAYRRTHALP